MKYKLRKVIYQGATKYYKFGKLYLNWFVPIWTRTVYYPHYYIYNYYIWSSPYKILTQGNIISVPYYSSHNFKGAYILFVDKPLTEEDLWTILSETKNKHVVEIITTLLQTMYKVNLEDYKIKIC